MLTQHESVGLVPIYSPISALRNLSIKKLWQAFWPPAVKKLARALSSHLQTTLHQEILGVFSAKTAKILENRALRAHKDGDNRCHNREFASIGRLLREIEDRAKTTHSISDFLGRDWVKKPPKNLKIG